MNLRTKSQIMKISTGTQNYSVYSIKVSTRIYQLDSQPGAASGCLLGGGGGGPPTLFFSDFNKCSQNYHNGPVGVLLVIDMTER